MALAGLGSRRECERILVDGGVYINGIECIELGTKVNIYDDKVDYNGTELLIPLDNTVIIFNKPAGVIVSKNDPEGRRTVYDLLPDEYKNFKHVGRLDLNSEGLLLFMSDGKLVRELLLPANNVKKEYLIRLNDSLSNEDISIVEKGPILEDGMRLKPIKVLSLKGVKNGYVLQLTEGKNREIRKIMEMFDRRVLHLKRTSFAGVELMGIKPGELREPTEVEMEKLTRYLK